MGTPTQELRAQGHSVEAIEAARAEVVGIVIGALHERRAMGYATLADSEIEHLGRMIATRLRNVIADAVLRTINAPSPVVPVSDPGPALQPTLEFEPPKIK